MVILRRRPMMQTASGGGKSDMNGWADGVTYTDLTIVKNQYCQSNTGKLLNYNGWDRTGYVPCGGAKTITFPAMPQNDSTQVGSNAFYDSAKNYVSRIILSRTESSIINVPSNAEYFIISSNAAAVASCIANGIVPHA